MKNFFYAGSFAVIGASRNPEKVGNVVFRNLKENPNLKVFPVNPNAYEILGEKAYPDVLSIPFIVDVAVICIPAEKVPEILEGCGKKGIRRVIIISSGFSESGNLELEKQVEEIGKKYNLKIIGPNVLGILSPYTGINASFFRDLPEKGKVAFISQSGAVGTSILDLALEKNLGFSGFISLGNMAGVDFLDSLEYFGNDIRTGVIMLYVESLKEGTGKDFVELCKRISKKKKIIAIKAGKTKEGMMAAKTHTASMSSDSKIYSGAFKQAGIIEVENLEEMFILGEIFSKYKKLGRKTGIITNAGGLGVLAADYCVKSGIELPEISEKAFKELEKFLPKGHSRNNPLDILGDALAERYEDTLKILMKHKLFDFFIVIVSPQEMTQPLETVQLLSSYGFPVFIFLQGGKSFSFSKKFLRDNRKLYFSDISKIKILGKAVSN